MFQYLAEVPINGRLQPVGLFSGKQAAFNAVEHIAFQVKAIGEFGLVTELEVGKVFPEGIGGCKHWHFVNTKESDDMEVGWH
jgi:hypothetical protein